VPGVEPGFEALANAGGPDDPAREIKQRLSLCQPGRGGSAYVNSRGPGKRRLACVPCTHPPFTAHAPLAGP